MKKPNRPSTVKRNMKRCDGAVHTWEPRWQWIAESCDECGRDYDDGRGRWYDANEPSFHLGEVTPDGVTRPAPQQSVAQMIVAAYSKGVWTCCKKKSPGLEEIANMPSPFRNALITDIRDPATLEV